MNEPTSRRERELARHRQEILNAAENLFAEHGFHDTTMQMIAERVEFSVGYLYQHFSGKDELYRQMVLYHLEAMDQLLAEVERLALPPLEDLRRSYQEICHHFNDHRDFMRIFHKEIGGSCDELLAHKQHHFDELVKNLDAAVQAGELKPCDVQLLAAAVQGATKDLFGVMAERPGPRPFDTLPEVVFTLLIDPQRA